MRIQIIFQSLLFKYELLNSKANDEIQFIDSSNEEIIIGKKLNEYLNDERLLNLPIAAIDRILKNHLNSKNDKNENDQIIQFLFKCLDKHKRKASILFLNIDINNQPKDLIIRLINDYSDIFDFNMINLKSILNTSSELLKELTKVKIEYDQKISEMNQIIEKQKDEMNKLNETRYSIENDFKNLIQKQNNIIEEQNKIINELKSTTISQQIQNEIMNQSNNYVTKEILMKLCLSYLIIYLNVVSILLYINKILCFNF